MRGCALGSVEAVGMRGSSSAFCHRYIVRVAGVMLREVSTELGVRGGVHEQPVEVRSM